MDKVRQYKAKAKRLFTYLKEIGKPIAHGQTLDAMARVEGYRDWNVFAAQVQQAPEGRATTVSESSGTPGIEPVRLRVDESGHRTELVVHARVHSDDKVATAEFDANAWFAQASDRELLELAEIEFGGDYASDAVAIYLRGTNAEVESVFRYVEHAHSWSDIGFECWVDETDAWKYLRAFRYAVFAQAACLAYFGSRTDMHEQGYGVFSSDTEPGKFYVRTPEGTFDRETEAQAWTMLGEELESLFALDNNLVDALVVRPGSGVLDRPAATPVSPTSESTGDAMNQPLLLTDGPLKPQELARVTRNGKETLNVVVPMGLYALVDGDLDWLNDEVSERITGSIADLSDLSYSMYRGDWPRELANTEVLIQVTAYWEPFANEHEEADEG